VETLHCGR